MKHLWKIVNCKLKIIIVFLLLCVVFLLPFMSMRNFSPVGDEITHLPSGYSYLRTGEIKLNPQHPPLIKTLAALPLLFLDLKFDPADPNLVGPKTNEWQFGRDFLFNNGSDRVIFWSRIPMILLSVLLGWYIYRWGKELFGTTETQNEREKKTLKNGERAGLLALFLYAFMPNIIAHSQLVTTDMGLAVFSFIALYYVWKFTESPTKRTTILSGLTLGLALGSKFSAVFLLPIVFVLLAVYVQKKHFKLDWLRKFNLLLKFILPIFGPAFLVVWALDFFPKDPFFYWNGLNTVYADHNTDYFYYLNGDFRQGGWWYYFLWAFIIKTPVPFLIVLLLAFIFYKKQNFTFLNYLFVLLPAALFLFIASWKAHNIGVRYILVIYPFLILFVGGYLSRVVENWQWIRRAHHPVFDSEGRALRLRLEREQVEGLKIVNCSMRTKITSSFVLMLVIWYVFSSLSIYPDYLAYFNELVGGSRNGYKYLDDSNIDWGQDLKRLAEYQKKNPNLQVAYAWDTYVDAEKLYGIKNIVSLNSRNLWFNPSGKYAVSTHAVIRTKLASQVHNDHQFNWMDNYKPIDQIGYSFFIYEFP